MLLVDVVKNRIVIAVLLFAISSCTTVYKYQDSDKTTYFLVKKSTIKEYVEKEKNKPSNEFDADVETNISSEKFRFDLDESRIIGYDVNLKNYDTLFLDTALVQTKKYLYPFCHLCSNTIIPFSNGEGVCKTDGNSGFWVKYIGDSLYSFNNKTTVKSLVFHYYSIDKNSNIQNATNPIRVSVSSVDGMLLSVEYFYYSRKMEIGVARKEVQDYRKVFATKRRLNRFLM